MAYLFYIWKFVPLDSLHAFHLPNPSEKHLGFLHYFGVLLANLVFFGKKKNVDLCFILNTALLRARNGKSDQS